MAAIHAGPFEGAGQTFEWKGHVFVAEDWWDRVYGKSWAWSQGVPAAQSYAMRYADIDAGIPTDDEVVYGHVEQICHLVHVSELREVS